MCFFFSAFSTFLLKLPPRNDGCFYMSFEDWVANFTVVSLCAVGTAPVPVEEEDPEDEDVDQDALSSEEEDPFSAFFGKTKNLTNEKIVRGEVDKFCRNYFSSNTYTWFTWCCFVWAELATICQRWFPRSASQSQGICVLGSWVKWSRDRDVGPTDVLCYQSAYWEVIQCQKIGSKKYTVYMTSETSLQQYERRLFWPIYPYWKIENVDCWFHIAFVNGAQRSAIHCVLASMERSGANEEIGQIWIQNSNASNDLKMFMKWCVIFSNGFVMFDTWLVMASFHESCKVWVAKGSWPRLVKTKKLKKTWECFIKDWVLLYHL